MGASIIGSVEGISKLLDTNKIIDDYLYRDPWWMKENANIARSNMALNMAISRAAWSQYWLEKVYTEKIRNAFKRRLFHIHNLGAGTTYCVGWNTEDILRTGFKGGFGTQTSAPPKHFGVALGQAVNFLFTLQGEADGAEALNDFDTYLAPFIAADGLTKEEVKQALQEFIYNMNVRTRIGGQAAFTNITLDQKVPKIMRESPVIIGGKYSDDVYGDFQDEMDIFNEAWWECRMEGDAKGRPQPFPIETLNVTNDFDWNDGVLFRAVALRGAPYFANFVNSDLDPEDVRSMCCRLRINSRELKKRGGGFFGANPLTGSVGVCTMNLPLIAYLTRDEDEFLSLLDTAMELASDSLELKREKLEEWTLAGQYPYSKIYLQSIYERFGGYWKNHFNTIGLIGMDEACRNLLGEGIASSAGLKFTLRVMKHMREKLIEFQDETENMYNLEATPAEGTAYRLAMEDKKEFPDIITAGEKDSPYYTNSTYLPVSTSDPFGFVLEHQSQIQPLYTGGTVFHIWGNEARPPWEGVSKLLRRIIENTPLPYITYSPTTSICPKHGVMSGEVWKCPICGSECEVWSRVTGYFSEVHNWNKGKRHEFGERRHFKVEER